MSTGMNEVFEALKAFEIELENFNDRLNDSFKDLDKNHDAVSSLWQDDMRKTYDLRWNSLEEQMKEYVTLTGQTYTEVLIQKITAIRGYLYGA